MEKMNVALADSNISLLLDAKNYFDDDNEINLIATLSNIHQLKSINYVDVLIIDLSMSTDDVSIDDCCHHFSKKPALVITVEEKTEDLLERTLRYSARLMLCKPYTMEDLRGKLLSLKSAPSSFRLRLNENKMLDEKLSNIFIRSGIPPHIKGYQFLREAVKLSVSKPDMINNITKKLYPSIADQFNTTASKVERAIRHAIEVAWSRGKIENINLIFGIKIYSKGEKPTNGELIALIADKLMIECG
ncbi:MAG: sporulation initiation factor Spo0A C-terminal domain-containing protein [Clostridia bacterium]|nr:sporulation initiation factor Spo0A C-terminal domain-containing protein [Clostridia bacterium]